MGRIVHCSGCNNVIPVPDHIKAATLACPQCKAPFANPHLALSSQNTPGTPLVLRALCIPATSQAAPFFECVGEMVVAALWFVLFVTIISFCVLCWVGGM
jgi:hypothetical protein